MSRSAPSDSTATSPKKNAAKSANPGDDESDKSLDPSRKPPFTHTRASGYWAAVVVGLLLLVVLLIFILENGQRAKVSFFGAHTHLPQGVALLFAAVIGGLFVVLAGAARILQLRSRAQGRVKNKPHRTTRRKSKSP